MVNSVQRLQEMKAFMRMGNNASDLRTFGWNGDGNGTNGTAKQLMRMPGIVQDSSGDLHFAEWNCRAGQNNVVVRTDGTVTPCFPMYSSPFDWGHIDQSKFDDAQLADMKKSCQRPLFFDAESQSRVLLRRLARYQVGLDADRKESTQGRSSQL